jgi:hypothetical protein
MKCSNHAVSRVVAFFYFYSPVDIFTQEFVSKKGE